MTQNCYSVKYDSRSTHQICDSCLCNFKNSHSCQTLSKAWATSGNIRQKYFFLSNVLLIMFVTRSWSMFECLYWNPNWWYVIKFLSSVSIFRCFKRSSSDSFHMLGSCDIERLDVQNHPEVFFLGGGGGTVCRLLPSISWATSYEVKCFIFSPIHLSGWYCTMSSSELISSGLNTCSRWRAYNSTFSCSLRAYDSSSLQFSGLWDLCLFMHLVTFHSE